MKKIIFLETKSNTLGGVALVNKTLAKEFVKKNYEVMIAYLRNSQSKTNDEEIDNVTRYLVNDTDKWETTRKRDVIISLKQGGIISFFKTFLSYTYEKKKKNDDYKKMKKKIADYNPDYIICSHYEMLNSIPKKMMKKTFVVYHSSFDYLMKENKSAFNILKKINNKIAKFVWLTEQTSKNAQKMGLTNSTYIYNAVRFEATKQAPVTTNKKMVTISRLSSKEKRIDLMISAVDKLFRENDNLRDWVLELYGEGVPDSDTLNLINNNKQIKLMGRTNKPQEVLMQSSIYLSTSAFEGFSLSILEASECGVPVVAYNFGESCSEEIINNETGIVVPFNNEGEYIKAILNLINNPNELIRLSNNSKNFARNFKISKISNEWEKLFLEI